MKHLKTKLTAAIVMLLISAMMLTGVSFAWYTLSTNPEVTNIKATAVANENLEIALDNFYTKVSDIDSASQNATALGTQGSTTTNDYTWGNMVDVSAQMTDADGKNAFELRPAEYIGKDGTGSGLRTYQYGVDGRISAVQALTDSSYYGPADGSKSTDTEKVSANQKNGVARIYRADSNTNYAFKVVYWLRTNKKGNIVLSEAAGRAEGANTANLATGGGSYISTAQYDYDNSDAVSKYSKDALHVAFKVTPYTGDTSGTEAWVADNSITYGDITKVKTSSEGTTPETYTGKVPLSGTIITDATPNQAYKVEMYVFLNGDVVTNAMAEEAISDIAVNVQFDNAAITGNGAMKY